MDDTTHRAGLCATCRRAQRIVSSKGSEFWRCLAAEEHPPMPKYPRLPVLVCAEYSGPSRSYDAERA